MAYLHKKFKKLASVDVVGDRKEKSPSPVIVNHNDNAHDRSNAPLKHSIGSMVAPVSPPGGLIVHEKRVPSRDSPDPSETSEKIILDQHIRTHSNERPYTCESCKFSFKIKSNLYKHFKSRSHILRIEKGLESSHGEILAELGESARDELETVILRPSEHYPPPHAYLEHPAQPVLHPRLVPGQQPPEQGLVLLPSHLVKPGPGIISPHEVSRLSYQGGHPPSAPFHLYPQSSSHIGLRYLDPGAIPIINGHIVPPEPHPPQLVRHRHERPSDAPHYPQVPQVSHGYRDPRDPRNSYEQHRQESERQEHAETKRSSHINAESLEQRINKVISENKAIVETLDPFWKGRYMRQSSREDANNKDRPRRYSQTTTSQPVEETFQPTVQPQPQPPPPQPQVQPPHNVEILHQQRPVPVSIVSRPPRPDSNIPLNLSETSRKRKSPENPLIDAHSVKEVWLNSQKMGNISHLKDVASKIEAKLRSSENPFHPDNPEGSIIKDLLLKTRGVRFL